MPEKQEPVYCTMCQSAVYCRICISKWNERRRECCYCKQTKPRGQFMPVMKKPEFAKVFEMAKIRCKRYPNCMEVLSLSKIEEHEKISCKFLPCRQCNRNLKTNKVSMQAHLQLHCVETKM
mmetsp:Transcript_4129/g.5090  ORF Transcript_4129/g.5090 Transcript_4129/m.5090 type:complete len:121 (+) Transcript_4129:463-825(+)